MQKPLLMFIATIWTVSSAARAQETVDLSTLETWLHDAANAEAVPLPSDLPTIEPPETTGTGQVIGEAKQAVPADWPATFLFWGQVDQQNRGFCTATVVGPRTVLTSAHCMMDRTQATISDGNRDYLVQCYHHPGYANNYQLDVALCLSLKTIGNPSGVIRLSRGDQKYEKVNSDPDYLSESDSLILLGGGCRVTVGDNPQRTLFISDGPVPINSISGAYADTEGDAALCKGDSGGASYDEADPPRRIYGVNSRSDHDDQSYFTVVASSEVAPFFIGWDQQFAICGVSSQSDANQVTDETNCRE